MLNISGDNSLLLLAVLLVCIFAFVICLPTNLIPENLYPLAILAIAFCLLFQVLWMSPYIMGSDVNTEYFLAGLASKTGHWSQNYPNQYENALSVTILPAIVQTLLAVDTTTIFKTMYPLAFSIVPVIMYLAYKHIVDSKRALLSSIFFMSFSSFYQDVSFIGKEQIGQVILALLLLFMLKGKLRSYAKPLTMLLLIAGLAISHYSLAFIFVAFLLLTAPILALLKMRRTITTSFVALVGVLTFAWVISSAQGIAFNSLVQLGYNVYEGTILNFFSAGARQPTVLKAFGVGVTPSPVNSIDLVVHYVIQFFIVVGLVRLWKQRKSVNGEFLFFMYLSLLLVVVSVALPYFAAGLNFTRVYQIALIFLSPACVLGGESIFSKLFQAFSILNRNHYRASFISFSDRNLTLAASIIILFLVFNTGFIHEVTGTSPISLSLGFNRMRESNNQGLLSTLYEPFITEQDHASAEWLSSYMVSNSIVCGDYISRFHVLLSYAGIPLEQGVYGITIMYPGPYGSIAGCDYVYLSYANLILGFGWGWDNLYPMSEMNSTLQYTNIVYSNGGSNILED